MINWRLLETEIIDIARSEGLELDRDAFGDVIVTTKDFDVNLTYFAQELSKRGVQCKGNVVKVKA